jgi:hypothetical protein
MVMRNIALTLLGLMFAACRDQLALDRSSPGAKPSSRETSVVTESPASIGAHPDSLRDDLVEHGLAVPDGRRQSVIAKLGRPDSTRSTAVPNRHRAALTDSIVDVFYPGLRLQYLVVGEGDSEFLEIADVWDNRYLKYPAMGVGASESAIVGALGEPGARTGDKYTYDCGRCIGGETPVHFHLASGRVTHVEYTFYVD